MATTDLKTTKCKVEWCLINRPKTRGDDMLLALTIWKNFHKKDFKDLLFKSLVSLDVTVPVSLEFEGLGNMGNLPSVNSCSRVRRKFNENGLYLPDGETMRKRGRKTIEVLDYLHEETLK